MNLSAVAIRRPVFTVMMTVALLVLGWVGFRSLGTDLFPDVSFPVVAITVPYPGASPTEIETLVTKPIEDSVVGLNQIDRVRSFSREGVSQVLVMFKLGKDISEGATEVREKVAGIRWKLPQEVKEPTINRWDVSATPIQIHTLASTKSLSAARKYAEDVIKPALEQVEGVAVVEVKGGATRQIRVELDRAKVDALKLDPAGIVMRLRAANLNVPAGHYDEGTKEVSVRTLGDFVNVDQIRDTIVATAADGSTVRLRDVARVDDSFADRTELIRSNGAETVSFQILKQSGKNTIEIADNVKAKLEELKKKFPAELSSNEIFDQSRFIKENVHEVETAIIFGGAMAILIILVFMLDIRSTLISAVALPTSVIGTFFVMYLLGYTLNMMTLLGLSLAIGLLIDDAVVVRENIFKHLEMGKPPAQAALDGTKEIALSVFATTLTIVAVFLPVAFVKGMVGQFFRQFGITISAAVMISLVVAFTLDPMLSSLFSKPIVHDPTKERFYQVKRPFLWFFAGMENVYRGMLHWAVHHKLIVGVLAIGSLFFMGFLAKLTGSEFVNAEDRGQFITELELPAGTSLDETSKLSARGEELLRKSSKHVLTVFATIEGNKAKWRVITTTKDKRLDTPINAIKDEARKAAGTIEGAEITLADPAFVEGAATEAPVMIDVRGSTYEDVLPVTQELAKILKKTPGLIDVRVKFSPGRPELQVEIDRQKAADLGLGVAQVALAIRTAMEGEEAGKLRVAATSTTKSEEVPIKVRLAKGDRDTEAALAKMTLATPKGPVKLLDVAHFVRGEGPQVIEREDRSRQVQVWAATKGRALGDIVTEIQPQIAAMKLPPGVSIAYDGQIKMMNETNSNLGTALLLGVVFIYIVLASQFESFIHPLTIMLTLPLAFVGAILGLFMAGTTLAMGAMIGIILLMGLVTKNAILLIDRAIVRVREHGETPLQAILEAGPERLRPILMTSAAMVLGMLPTALGKGEGSEFRSPMAIAVIGGVISSTLLSLIVVPAFYVAIESLKGWIRKLRGQAPVSRREPLGSPAE
jgi:HAE1 family hydrophobic/amphiphilic exporter-1